MPDVPAVEMTGDREDQAMGSSGGNVMDQLDLEK